MMYGKLMIIPYLNDRGMGSVAWSVAVFSYPALTAETFGR